MEAISIKGNNMLKNRNYSGSNVTLFRNNDPVTRAGAFDVLFVVVNLTPAMKPGSNSDTTSPCDILANA